MCCKCGLLIKQQERYFNNASWMFFFLAKAMIYQQQLSSLPLLHPFIFQLPLPFFPSCPSSSCLCPSFIPLLFDSIILYDLTSLPPCFIPVAVPAGPQNHYINHTTSPSNKCATCLENSPSNILPYSPSSHQHSKHCITSAIC